MAMAYICNQVFPTLRKKSFIDYQRFFDRECQQSKWCWIGEENLPGIKMLPKWSMK